MIAITATATTITSTIILVGNALKFARAAWDVLDCKV